MKKKAKDFLRRNQEIRGEVCQVARTLPGGGELREEGREEEGTQTDPTERWCEV